MLTGKVILIISPQSWDGLWVSKHHYAYQLAERGNRVFFLDPPVTSKSGDKTPVRIYPSGMNENLFIVRNFLHFPYFIKFHIPFLFYLFIRPQIRKIMESIGGRADIVWSFDLSDVYPLRFFRNIGLRIFHPVDMPHTSFGIEAARKADILLSTSPEILELYKKFKIPSFFIDHGLADVFTKEIHVVKVDRQIRIGYSGNLLRPDIDRACLLEIIGSNPSVNFEFWGSDAVNDGPVNRFSDTGTKGFIERLRSMPNVCLNGPVSFEKLPYEFARMDGFLICYDLSAKNYIGPNYHKIMEYLSSGKVIVSSYVSLYEGKPDLLQMATERTNMKLPELFNTVIADIDFHNASYKQVMRIAHARSNTYGRQLDKIENALSASGYL